MTEQQTVTTHWGKLAWALLRRFGHCLRHMWSGHRADTVHVRFWRLPIWTPVQIACSCGKVFYEAPGADAVIVKVNAVRDLAIRNDTDAN